MTDVTREYLLIKNFFGIETWKARHHLGYYIYIWWECMVGHGSWLWWCMSIIRCCCILNNPTVVIRPIMKIERGGIESSRGPSDGCVWCDWKFCLYDKLEKSGFRIPTEQNKYSNMSQYALLRNSIFQSHQH